VNILHAIRNMPICRTVTALFPGHNKSTGLSRGVSWALYPTGQGYN